MLLAIWWDTDVLMVLGTRGCGGQKRTHSYTVTFLNNHQVSQLERDGEDAPDVVIKCAEQCTTVPSATSDSPFAPVKVPSVSKLGQFALIASYEIYDLLQVDNFTLRMW